MAGRKLVAANWKMNKTIREADAFADGLLAGLDAATHCDLLVAPPYLALPHLAERLKATPVVVAAQDVYWEEAGAFTGEVSCGMVRDAGGRAVIVGHSERRHVMGEDDGTVARKLRAVIDAGLIGVLCVGETLDERDAGRHEAVVRSQVDAALGAVDGQALDGVVLAYEPVWAIGTGRTATPEDASAMHFIARGAVAERFGDSAADGLRILYGGSVKPDNAGALLARDGVDGALVGGASLDPASFLAIATAAR